MADAVRGAGDPELSEGGQSSVIPFRFFGFGFYWAWVFSCTMTVTPTFGTVVIGGSVPYEVAYLVCRTLAMLAVLLSCRRVARESGVKALVATCTVLGSAATFGLSFVGGDPSAALGWLVCLGMGVADASMFTLWMCFFCQLGSAKTVAFLGASYALGAVLSFLVSLVAAPFNLVMAALFPMLSAATFLASLRLEGAPLSFEGGGAAGEGGATGLSLGLILTRMASLSVLRRLCVAFLLYGVVFGVYKAIPVAGGFETAGASASMQLIGCVALGLAVVAGSELLQAARASALVYVPFRFIPLVLVVGAALSLYVPAAWFPAASLPVSLGYNLFEVLSFGVLANLVYRRGLQPVAAIALQRVANSAGILAGFVAVLVTPAQVAGHSALMALALVAVCVVVLASTVVFNERELRNAMALAEEVEDGERGHAGAVDLAAVCDDLAARFRLSNRETEVLHIIARGRGAAHVAKTLYISEGTAKTHIASIYRKLDIHTKQELLDIVEERSG